MQSSRRRLYKGFWADVIEMIVALGPVVGHLNVIGDIFPGQILFFIDEFSDSFFFSEQKCGSVTA